MGGAESAGKHAFLCYAPVDATAVDRLQEALEAALCKLRAWAPAAGLLAIGFPEHTQPTLSGRR